MAHRLTTVHHDDERSLTAEEIDQELEEGINRKGLGQRFFNQSRRLVGRQGSTQSNTYLIYVAQRI